MATRAFRVPVADLRRRLGQRREVDVDHDPGPLAVGTSRTVGQPVTGTLTIESIQGGVSVSGELRTAWVAECRRCLAEVEGEAVIDVHEIYQVHAPPDSDIYELWSEDQVDLAPMIRESVLLSLPLGRLCDAGCQGPDPERFPATPETEVDTAGGDEGAPALDEPTDPRWAALGEVRFDDR
jgi:uncharacterized protein